MVTHLKVCALCLWIALSMPSSKAQRDTIGITVVASPTDPAMATFVVNCPADGFGNTFVVYFGTSIAGAPVDSGTQAASGPVRCSGVSQLSYKYQAPGTFTVRHGGKLTLPPIKDQAAPQLIARHQVSSTLPCARASTCWAMSAAQRSS